MGRVVFCMPKAYGTIGAARAGRLSSTMVVQFPFKEQAVGSNPTLYKNAKTAPDNVESGLKLDRKEFSYSNAASK